jgi:hypothetical protein
VHLGLLLAALSAASSPRAGAQALVKVNDVAYFRLGFYLQAQADWTQLANTANTDTDGYQQNLFLRRVRFLLAGRVAPNLYFFMETDNPRLGYNKSGSTALGSGFQLIDGLAEWRLADALILDGGLIAVPYSRVALTGSIRLFFFDADPYGYLQQTATQSTAGNRDTGFLARGYFLDHRLEYRIGVFQGVRLPGVKNAFRASGRVQWEFFDREDLYSPSYIGGAFYPGTYLATKKVLAVGTGFDTQMDFRYYSGDIFAAIPIGDAGSVEGQVQYQYLDGGVTFTTLSVQNTFAVDAGFFVKSLTFAPVFRYEQRTYNGQPARDESRSGVSLNYYVHGHNFNIKVAYIRIAPTTGVSTNQFAIQLQAFYY